MVDHTPQARKTMGKVKSPYRDQAEAKIFFLKTQCGKTTGRRRENPL